MPDGLDRLDERVSTLERSFVRLRELVDGQESWSHRKQLHDLRNAVAGEQAVTDTAEKIRAALAADHVARDRRAVRLREWGSFAVAIAAVLIAWSPWS